MPFMTLKIVSIPLACAVLSALAGIMFEGAPANAHDWYPRECSARKACMPAGGLEGGGRGAMTAMVGDLRIAIPESLAPRRSPDSRIHVCFSTYPNEIDGNITITPICLFLPAQP